jgi:hypothetical protein
VAAVRSLAVGLILAFGERAQTINHFGDQLTHGQLLKPALWDCLCTIESPPNRPKIAAVVSASSPRLAAINAPLSNVLER